MTRISKISTSIIPQTKSIERQAHEAWVKYFNSHILFLSNPRDEFVPRGIITPGGIGYNATRYDKTAFDDVKGEMQTAVNYYKHGNKKMCETILKLLSGINPDFDVYATFRKML